MKSNLNDKKLTTAFDFAHHGSIPQQQHELEVSYETLNHLRLISWHQRVWKRIHRNKAPCHHDACGLLLLATGVAQRDFFNQ
jgi:hypothetical protein